MASPFSAKRRRDDSDDELDRSDGKRLRALPLRESPTSRHPTPSFSLRHFSKPPSLVPAGESSSGSDESSPEPTFASPSYPARPAIPTFVSTNADTDMDYAMADDDASGSPMWSPKAVRAVLGPSPAADFITSPAYPSLLSVSSETNTATARVPTPILGSFAAARTTRPAGLAAAGFNGAPNSLSPIPAPGATAQDGGLLLAHDPLRRRRPLPSPISEDTSSPTAMMRDLDMGGTPLTASAPKFPAGVLTPLSPEFARRGGMAEGSEPASTAFRRRRSDAISGGESGGGKVVFSMGYRADCEKCREKVPGHYSHVLRV